MPRMLLAIDAGNTAIKIGCHDGQTWQSKQRIGWSDFYLEPMRYLRQSSHPIAIASVVGATFQSVLERILPDCPKLWVQATAQACGVTNQYQKDQLGADRWAMLIAARAMVQQPCIVVSLGTALTVDTLTADGVFLGGSIAPGVKLMRAALARGTHGIQVPLGNVCVIPGNTADAVETGIVYALLGGIEKMIANFEPQSRDHLHVILTGGDAHLLAPHLTRPVHVVDNLVLEGLIVLAQKEDFL